MRALHVLRRAKSAAGLAGLGGGPATTNRLLCACCSHDDEVNKEASEYVLKITKQRQNPDGCDIPITW